eukprot:144432_1
MAKIDPIPAKKKKLGNLAGTVFSSPLGPNGSESSTDSEENLGLFQTLLLKREGPEDAVIQAKHNKKMFFKISFITNQICPLDEDSNHNQIIVLKSKSRKVSFICRPKSTDVQNNSRVVNDFILTMKRLQSGAQGLDRLGPVPGGKGAAKRKKFSFTPTVTIIKRRKTDDKDSVSANGNGWIGKIPGQINKFQRNDLFSGTPRTGSK